MKRYYGSKSRPQVEIEIEESDGGPACLILNLLDDNGIGTRATARLQRADDSPKVVGELGLAGTSRIQGRQFRYRVKLSSDRSTLKVSEPKSVLLLDGSKLELAGRYRDLSEEARYSVAKGTFEAVDKELNAVYRKLIATLVPAGLEKLRAEQRRWLKYRDFTIYGGDNANIVGPGTAPHFRQQGRRTIDRIEFLRALLVGSPRADAADNTFYSDGRGGSIAVRRVGDTVLFVVLVPFPNLNSADASGVIPFGLSGLARSASGDAWLAEPGNLVATVGSWTLEPLRLTFDPANGLRVDAAGDSASAGLLARVVGGSYHRLRALKPAEEPLRSLLLQLPEKAFEETTEGLSLEEKKSLVIHFDDGLDLRVSLWVNLETPKPDFCFGLAWDGYGFALERMEN